MALFGCANDEQFNLEFNPSKIKCSDLKKLFNNYSLKMEQFLKDKGLYNEFYNKCIVPDIKLDIDFSEVLSNATFSK